MLVSSKASDNHTVMRHSVVRVTVVTGVVHSNDNWFSSECAVVCIFSLPLHTDEAGRSGWAGVLFVVGTFQLVHIVA